MTELLMVFVSTPSSNAGPPIYSESRALKSIVFCLFVALLA